MIVMIIITLTTVMMTSSSSSSSSSQGTSDHVLFSVRVKDRVMTVTTGNEKRDVAISGCGSQENEFKTEDCINEAMFHLGKLYTHQCTHTYTYTYTCTHRFEGGRVESFDVVCVAGEE